MQHFRRIIGYWIPLAVVASGLCFFTYVAVQQNYRMNANDPQIEMAQNAVLALKKGQTPDSIIPGNQVDLAASLSPFMIIYDSAGKAVASSGVLNGQIPAVPMGVLTSALKSGENRVTWEPQPDVRIAAVVDSYSISGSEGYVLAGRSLKEVEARISNLTLMLTITWLCALVASLIAIIFAEYFLLHPKNGTNPAA
jgi:hypothetical protein